MKKRAGRRTMIMLFIILSCSLMFTPPSLVEGDFVPKPSKEFSNTDMESIQQSKNEENNIKCFLVLGWFKSCCTFVGELFGDHKQEVHKNRMRQIRMNDGVLPPQVSFRWGTYFYY